MIEQTSRSIIITDSGPLIHLDELNCLDLLNDFNEIMVPDSVWREVQVHRPESLQSSKIKLMRTISPDCSSEIEHLAPLYSLHSGELEALTLCLAFPSCIFLTDDTAARLAAKALNISAHGTIGVLVRAIRRQQRSKAEILKLLSTISGRTTLYLRPAFLADVIRDLEQRIE